MSVLDTLHQRLANKQVIPFVAYMQQVLYAPLDGYYSSGLSKFGPCGDFITAPELTPLFGQCLGGQCQQILTSLDHPVILEYGAGTGKLAVDLLTELEHLNCLPEQYLILELSAALRHQQEQLIYERIPHLAPKISWINTLSQASFNGILIANEVLDAMPVHRFLKTKEAILESHIGLNEDNQLIKLFQPCQNQDLLEFIEKRLSLTSYPYLSEVNLFLDDWILNNYQLLNHGAMIIIDYGFPRHEYYHPDRNQGTLICHHHHRAHTNVLQNPGEQDISAHVDFTHVAEAAQAAGFHVAGYTNQASFLLNNDLLSLLERLSDPKEQFRAKQAIKQLLHPSEMGELFKVMALTKKIDIELKGFQFQDKRVSL